MVYRSLQNRDRQEICDVIVKISIQTFILLLRTAYSDDVLDEIDDAPYSTAEDGEPASTRKPEAKQTKITQFSHRPVSKFTKQNLDGALLEFVVKDLQAYSIVESSSFRKFVAKLNPGYSLPARKTLSTNMMTSKYAEVSGKIMAELDKTNSVCITTDAWTSRNNDSFIAVTCHFVDVESERLKSVLLSCFLTTERHTSENLADELKRVLREWGVWHKAVAIVTDNCANIVNAVEHQLKKKHVGCFAHTLNLAVQDGLSAVNILHTNVKDIVSHFKRSTVSANKLSSTQTLKKEPVLKVKQAMPTRWNSSLFMFRRIIEVFLLFCS